MDIKGNFEQPLGLIRVPVANSNHVLPGKRVRS